MKKVLLNIYRGIVGNEYGWSGEGNEQWYYFLALVMNCMLTWWLKPEIGILFTVFSVVHFAMMFPYEYFFMDDFQSKSIVPQVVYFSIHLVMFVTSLIVNWPWTLITSSIVVIACLLAPDCTGNNVFMRPPKYGIYFGNNDYIRILICHTIWFAMFVIITFLLPVSIWIKLAIIATCIILHPFIDFLEGECINISDITEEAFWKIAEKIKGDNEELL